MLASIGLGLDTSSIDTELTHTHRDNDLGTMTESAGKWYTSPAFKVIMLGLFGLCCMMAVALSLAFTLGAPKPFSPVLYSSIEDPAMTVTSNAEDCSTPELGACGTVLMYDSPKDSLKLSATVPGNSSDAASVTFQVCYAKPFTVGRPWRSPKDVIGKDKQCGIKACANVAIEGGTAECTYTVGDVLGQGVYYTRALAADSEGTFIMGNTDMDQYFQIDAYNGRTTSIIIGASVMSAVAWAILAAGLIMERVKKD